MPTVTDQARQPQPPNVFGSGVPINTVSEYQAFDAQEVNPATSTPNDLGRVSLNGTIEQVPSTPEVTPVNGTAQTPAIGTLNNGDPSLPN